MFFYLFFFVTFLSTKTFQLNNDPVATWIDVVNTDILIAATNNKN